MPDDVEDYYSIPAISMAEFSQINKSYDPNVPLAKPRPQEWRKKALCRIFSPRQAEEIFYPPSSLRSLSRKGKSHEAFQRARRICKRCPVKVECLNAALREEAKEPYQFGFRGAKDPLERRAILKQLNSKSSTHQQKRGKQL